MYHAFYATRVRGTDGSVQEAICRAAGTDLIHFEKSQGNPPFSAPPGLDPRNHRDPCVFHDAGTGFHMLVTASRPPTPGDEQGERGVLAHYTSDDLDEWQYQGPFLLLDKDPTPECPEVFEWNGWWYLVYSQGAQMQYQVARGPLGPWHRVGRGTIEGPNLSVPRTASWTGGRRLAAGFLPWRQGDHDAGGYVYAGSAVFRELVQAGDGTLSTRFVPEMMPPTGPLLALIPRVPANAVLSCRLVPEAGAGEYGLLLRADEALETGYRLSFDPQAGRAALRFWPEGGETRAVADGVGGLDRAVDVVICMKDSVIDVCVNNSHTLAERCFDHRGTHLSVFAEAGGVRVEGLSVVGEG